MNSSLFILWNCSRGGWITASATTSTEIGDAKRFSLTEALHTCHVHFQSDPLTFGLIPVSEDHLVEIMS